MHRRRFLCATTALLTSSLAGCAHPVASLTMTPIDAAGLAERASSGLGSEDRSLVANAIENGSATATDTRPPFAPDRPVAYDGRYYTVSWSVADEREAFSVDIEIDYDADSPEGKRVRFDELPHPDRAALSPLLPPRTERRTAGMDVGAVSTYTESERDSSALVPEQRYDVVLFDGKAYPISATSRPTTLRDYRYVATEVAANATAYAEQVRTDHRFTLSGLSKKERENVRKAIDEGYHVGSTPSGAFQTLADRFHDHDPVKGDHGYGQYVVRYEGAEYWADLTFPTAD